MRRKIKKRLIERIVSILDIIIVVGFWGLFIFVGFSIYQCSKDEFNFGVDVKNVEEKKEPSHRSKRK